MPRLSYRHLALMVFLAVILYGLFLFAQWITLEMAVKSAGASAEFGEARGTPTLVVPWHPKGRKK